MALRSCQVSAPNGDNCDISDALLHRMTDVEAAQPLRYEAGAES